MVSGLRLAFVTTKTGWPDGDAGCGSSWTHPVTTTNLGFFDCPAAVAARQRHVATTTIPVGLICTSEESVRMRVCNRSATKRDTGSDTVSDPSAEACCRVDSALGARWRLERCIRLARSPR